MPTSVAEGKDWLIPRIIAEVPAIVLDVGAGEGLYAKLLGRHRGLVTYALEIHEPYVAQFGLEDLYDLVLIGDVRTRELPEVDVVILGDVIEHFTEADAQRVWDKARRLARKTVLASIPLGEHPQGAVNDNEHERHLSTWTDAKIHALGGVVASWTGSVVGCYAVAPAS